MQPTVGIKNALQEGRPIPRTVPALYRGLAVGGACSQLPCSPVSPAGCCSPRALLQFSCACGLQWLAAANVFFSTPPTPASLCASLCHLQVSAGAMLPITAVQFGMNRALEQGYRRVTGAEKLTTGGTVAVALGAGGASAFLGCPAE